jgi:hypothetical protein
MVQHRRRPQHVALIYIHDTALSDAFGILLSSFAAKLLTCRFSICRDGRGVGDMGTTNLEPTASALRHTKYPAVRTLILGQLAVSLAFLHILHNLLLGHSLHLHLICLIYPTREFLTMSQSE